VRSLLPSRGDLAGHHARQTEVALGSGNGASDLPGLGLLGDLLGHGLAVEGEREIELGRREDPMRTVCEGEVCHIPGRALRISTVHDEREGSTAAAIKGAAQRSSRSTGRRPLRCLAPTKRTRVPTSRCAHRLKELTAP